MRPCVGRIFGHIDRHISEKHNGALIAVALQGHPLRAEKILAENMEVNFGTEHLRIFPDGFRLPAADIFIRPGGVHQAGEMCFQCSEKREIADPGIVPTELLHRV